MDTDNNDIQIFLINNLNSKNINNRNGKRDT